MTKTFEVDPKLKSEYDRLLLEKVEVDETIELLSKQVKSDPISEKMRAKLNWLSMTLYGYSNFSGDYKDPEEGFQSLQDLRDLTDKEAEEDRLLAAVQTTTTHIESLKKDPSPSRSK